MVQRKMKQQAPKPKMTTFGRKKKTKSDIDFAQGKRKSSKKKRQRETKERFKPPRAEVEQNIEQIRCHSNVAPKKARRSSLFEIGAELERLEEEVAAKRAETAFLRQQLMEDKTKVEACLEKLFNLRMFNALLFLGKFN